MGQLTPLLLNGLQILSARHRALQAEKDAEIGALVQRLVFLEGLAGRLAKLEKGDRASHVAGSH